MISNEKMHLEIEQLMREYDIYINLYTCVEVLLKDETCHTSKPLPIHTLSFN